MNPLNRRTALKTVGALAVCALPAISAVASSIAEVATPQTPDDRAAEPTWHGLALQPTLDVFEAAAKAQTIGVGRDGAVWVERNMLVVRTGVHGAFAASCGLTITTEDLVRAMTLDAIERQAATQHGMAGESAQRMLLIWPHYDFDRTAAGQQQEDFVYEKFAFFTMHTPELTKRAESMSSIWNR